MGVVPLIVPVPLEIARALRPQLLHWGEALTGSAQLSIAKALRDIDGLPRFGIEAGYRDAHAWWQREGRGGYRFDYSAADELRARLGRG